MTVQTTSNVATGIGNGVTTVFPVGYKFNEESDLVVLRIDDATSAAETLTLNSDYTVQGAGNEAGGSVTMAAPLAVGKTLTITRIVDILQLTDLRNQGKFFAEVHEDSFDKFIMIMQQLFQAVGDSLQLNAARNRWDAKGRRIINVGDPVNAQDAVTKSWLEAYIAALLQTSIGPVQTAASVIYVGPDGELYTLQDLASTTDPAKGVSLVGFSATENLRARVERALSGDVGKKYKILSFVIRQTASGNGWFALDDSGHAPTGLDSISVTGNNLTLNFDFDAEKVGTFIVTPDETFASQGVSVGASVGTSSAILSFYAPISGSVTGLGVEYNTTLGNVTSQVINSDSIVITHPSLTHTAATGMGTALAKFGTNSYVPAISSTKTSLTVMCMETFSGRFACTDATPGSEVFSLTEAGGAVGFSAAWNSTKQCVIITHPNVLPSSPKLMFDQSRDASVRYLMSTDTHSPTSVELHFYDLSGAKITAATTSMIFHAFSNDPFPIALPGATRFASIIRNEVPCDANVLSHPSGNFWVFGVFEI